MSKSIDDIYRGINYDLINHYNQGVSDERKRITERIKEQICFDALADDDGRCLHHKGKCYELGLLIKELQEDK